MGATRRSARRTPRCTRGTGRGCHRCPAPPTCSRACAERGWRVVPASSASGQEVEVMIRALDADEAVHALTTADDVSSSKPAPDLVGRALARAGASARRAVFVGDAVWDAQAAVKAGVRCLAVLSGGFSPQELREAGAEAVSASPADLLARLDDSALATPAAVGTPGRRPPQAPGPAAVRTTGRSSMTGPGYFSIPDGSTGRP
ncbi:HAD family hydrolase [Streptomyces sp. NPDC059092]|uniref:HAD family hydrolase n=1 Tax=Streptomyces sp. NPDC059092 TaxID=3346725 RepID=UPI0036CEA298